MKEDITIQLAFLKHVNGITMFPEHCWSQADIMQLATDSAGSPELGCGGYFNGRWFYFPWPTSWKNSKVMKDVTFLEQVPIVIVVGLLALKQKSYIPYRQSGIGMYFEQTDRQVKASYVTYSSICT